MSEQNREAAAQGRTTRVRQERADGQGDGSVAHGGVERRTQERSAPSGAASQQTRPESGPGMRQSGRGRRDAAAGRTPLRETVAELDRDILRLLMRRHNLLERMRGRKGFLEPAEDRFLRESWQGAVARVSRDPDLSGRFFALMQAMTFLPRPAAENGSAAGDDSAAVSDGVPRDAFNLAPARKELALTLDAPLARWSAQAWLFLAAMSGQAISLAPCLMDDALADFVRALAQTGAQVTRERDGVLARAGRPAGRPDKVLHLGDSAWSLFLLLALYLGVPSRVKFMGGTALSLADLTPVRHFLPLFGARLTSVIPRSAGLPARLECSGILPERAVLPAEVPAELGAALLLAAPSYERGLALDLSSHPRREELCARVLPLLRDAGAQAGRDGDLVRVLPGPLCLPASPSVPVEPALAAFLLALAAPLGGSVQLRGRWPAWPDAGAVLELLQALGLPVERGAEGQSQVRIANAAPVTSARLSALPRVLLERLPRDLAPLPLAVAACAALAGGEADAPAPVAQALGCEAGDVADFFRAACLRADDEGVLRREAPGAEQGQGTFAGPVWNAPSPAWALALAVAACARPRRCLGFRLGNPGIVTALFPAFWSLYNGLPSPTLERRDTPEAPAPRERRRIRTTAQAVLPEMPETEEDGVR